MPNSRQVLRMSLSIPRATSEYSICYGMGHNEMLIREAPADIRAVVTRLI